VSTVAFTIKAPIGRVMFSADTDRGGFMVGGGAEVVMHPGPALALLVRVGPDGFALLFTLATLARPDEDGRLVVEGGVERVRATIEWSKNRAQNVFNRLAELGFVTREQDRRTTGRARFATTRLILDSSLYQPAPPPAGEPAFDRVSPGGTAAPVLGSEHRGSGGVSPGGTGAPISGTESPATELSGTESAGSEHRGSDGVSPDGTVAPMFGTGQAGTMSDDDVTVSSSSLPGRDRASRLADLAMLGFSDAAEVVDTTDPDVLDRSLQWLAEHQDTVENPGGYLRRLLTAGGPAPPRTFDPQPRDPPPPSPARQPDAAPPPPGPPAPPPGVWPDDDPSMAAAELDARLAALPLAVRDAFEAAADEEVAAVAERFRRRNLRLPPAAVAATRHQRLVELVTAYEQTT
jgi:hypothetical protein